jgi:hypothetical protein
MSPGGTTSCGSDWACRTRHSGMPCRRAASTGEYGDDADRTCVYSDSTTMRGAIGGPARQLGVEIRRVGGHGVEFELPADGPASPPAYRWPTRGPA